jgi:hypothetical protein
MVDMSPEAVTARLRLMGELCEKLMNERAAEERKKTESDTEIVETDKDGSQLEESSS